MARSCQCAGAGACGCKVTVGSGLVVTGVGSEQNPIHIAIGDIAIGSKLDFVDSSTIEWTVVGDGETGDPLQIEGDVITGGVNTSTPTNGSTTVLATDENLRILTPAGTIATGTVELPATTTAFLSEVTVVSNGGAITALTVTSGGGHAVLGEPTTLANGGFFRMRLVGSSWYRVG